MIFRLEVFPLEKNFCKLQKKRQTNNYWTLKWEKSQNTYSYLDQFSNKFLLNVDHWFDNGFFFFVIVYILSVTMSYINVANNMVDRNPTKTIILLLPKLNRRTRRYHKLDFNMVMFSRKIFDHANTPVLS